MNKKYVIISASGDQEKKKKILEDVRFEWGFETWNALD